ncbi:MAG TPA: sigma-70 family RNA polymerase sigma factor [Dehalococcoidia bacterium]|nr:sigma-70 family RNA polymerase sigma factor [Dehalococcoidia bacterium]
MRDVSPDETAYTGLDDEELMQRLVYRDLRAFRALFDRYGNLVYSAALRVVRDAQIAEDMVQEIFLRIWRKPESYVAQRGRFVTWLTSVTRNRAVDEIRSRGRRFRHETASPEEQERELPAPDTNDPALTVELADQRRLILAALAQIPQEQRQIIELAYFGGFTQQEIAQRLSQPLGTVKTRIRLGMQKLRVALTPELKWEER